METADKQVQIRLGGRVHQDYVFWGDNETLENSIGSLIDGTEIRRARLYVQGCLYERVEFKAQYDFAGGAVDVKDVYMGVRGLAVGVRLGHFKEPFSLEELASSNYVNFMERSLINAFAPSRNVGFRVAGTAYDERFGWAAGVFRDTDGFGFGAGNNYNLTGRISGTPVYRNGGRHLLHLGVGYSRKEVDEAVRFRSGPGIHLAPRFVDTGPIPASSARLIDLEAALVLGAFSLQGEYVDTSVNTVDGDLSFDGFYVFASFFVTGENRSYSRGDGSFDRLRPRRNFLVDGGLGAFELVARYSELDLTDGPVVGGELASLTLGLNWYLNPMIRVMTNYVRSDLGGIDTADALAWRTQINF